MKIKAVRATVAVLLLTFGLVGAAWAQQGKATTSKAGDGDAMARTKALIQAFEAVKVAPEGEQLDAEARKHNEQAYATLDGFFAYEHLTSAAIEPHRQHFEGDQLQTFKDRFREVIRLVAYPGSGDFFRQAKYELKQAPAKGAVAPTGKKVQAILMDARLPEEDLETEVTFFWAPMEDGKLQIIDVAFEGSSLVRDYRNQFGRIIKKEGAQSLMNKLEERRQQELKEQGLAQ